MLKRFMVWLQNRLSTTRITEHNLSSVTLVKDGVAKTVVYRNGVEESRTITPAEEASVVAQIKEMETMFSDIHKGR